MLPGLHRWLLVLSGVAIAALAPGAQTARAADDADIFALIDSLKAVADAINPAAHPWSFGAIPSFPDPVGDAGANPGEDITGVAIAPRANDLLVRFETAGPPSATTRVFWLQLDFLGQQFYEIKIGLDPNFADPLDVFPEGQPGLPRVFVDLATVTIVGNSVEVELPYAALDAQLPVAMQGQLTGPGARSWVRLKVTSGEPFFTEIDHGSAVGSFRLVTTPYPLDPPLPAGSSNAMETPFPLEGIWYLGQGTHGVGTHAPIPWAYDLHRTDNALVPEAPPGSTDNDDNFGFGSAIRAPLSATVFSLLDSEVDLPAHTFVCCSTPNFMFLEIPGDVGLLFSHTKMNSIPFAQMDVVHAGATIGRVGNSGSPDSWAHLHYEAQDTAVPQPFPSLPMAWTNVEVGLNPDAQDPWRREFASWGPREGFFVEGALPVVPTAGPLALAALVAFLGTLGGVMARASRRSGR